MTRARFVEDWTRHETRIRAFLAAGCRDAVLIDDLTQEVATAAWSKHQEFEGDRPFVNWVIGIARLALLRHRRDAARQRVILAPDVIDRIADTLIEQSEDLDMRISALTCCRGKLGEPARHLLELRYKENLPLAEIARRLGRSHGSIRTSLTRIRDALRTCIEAWIQEKNTGSIRGEAR